MIFIPLFRGACGAPRLLPGWERRGQIPPLPSVRNQRNKTTPSHWIPARTRGFLGSGFVFPFPFLPHPPHSLSTFPSLPFPFFFSKDTRSCSILFSQLEFSGLGSERRFKNKTKQKQQQKKKPTKPQKRIKAEAHPKHQPKKKSLELRREAGGCRSRSPRGAVGDGEGGNASLRHL